jgi:putative redox protein
MKITLSRLNDDYLFLAANEAGNTVQIDDGPDGASPLQIVVMTLGACSGIDIVSILKKGRQRIESFDMELEATKEKRDTYSEFTAIHAHYILTGDLDPARVRRAVQLSLDKYCSVSKLLEKTADITSSFSVNGVRYD